MKNIKIIITGGGSGGHVSAAQGIISEIKKTLPTYKTNLLYVGGKLVSESFKSGKSIEQIRFENSDIPFKAIRAGKLQRQMTWQSLKLLWNVLGGFVDAYKIVKNFRPNFVFSTGGFVSLPVCYMAWWFKIPVFLHEQTAAVGLTNTLVGRIAKKVYIAFPQSAKYFKHAQTYHTGNILRGSIFIKNSSTELANGIEKMLPNKSKFPIMYISGGGQGSHFLNLQIRQMLKYILLEYQIVHQIGDNNINSDFAVLNAEKRKLPKTMLNRYLPVKYVGEDEIGYLFDKIDVYVGRAGANIIYELGILQKPSILIPIPWVTHNEQYLNAKILVDCGTGLIVPEGEITAERFYQILKKFKKDFINGDYSPKKEVLESIFVLNGAERIVRDIMESI